MKWCVWMLPERGCPEFVAPTARAVAEVLVRVRQQQDRNFSG